MLEIHEESCVTRTGTLFPCHTITSLTSWRRGRGLKELVSYNSFALDWRFAILSIIQTFPLREIEKYQPEASAHGIQTRSFRSLAAQTIPWLLMQHFSVVCHGAGRKMEADWPIPQWASARVRRAAFIFNSHSTGDHPGHFPCDLCREQINKQEQQHHRLLDTKPYQQPLCERLSWI